MGEYIESERHLKRARDLYRQELGEEHHMTLKSASRLGEAYSQRGFADESSQVLEEARQLLEQTAVLQRRILGEEHIDTIWTLMSLASVLSYQGRPEEGLVLVEQLLPRARRTWGDEDRGTLWMMNGQGCMLRKLRRFAEALPVFQHALEISRRVRGEADPYTLLLEDNTAQTLTWMKGRTDEAVMHRLRAVDGRRQVLGEGHPSTIWSVLNLRLDVRHFGAAADGGPSRAVELIQGTVQAAPESGAAWTALGMARYEAGEWKSAIETFEKSLEVRKSGNSADWFLLSMACSRLGNHEAARKWFDQAAQWMDRNQPDNRSLREFRAGAEKLLKIADAKPRESEVR